MSECAVAERWLQGTLLAVPGLAGKVYGYVADSETAYPFLVFSLQSGTDVFGTGPYRMKADLLYLVKAVTDGRRFDPADTLYALADKALHGKSYQAVTGGQVLSCTREQIVRYAERTADGFDYRHTGGIYRLQVQLEED